MAASSTRNTSKDIVIDFLPNCVAATHVQKLYFHADITGGTFRLRVNGYQTADITMSGTPATDVTSIQTALDALTNLDADEITVSGTAITEITLTGSEDKWYTILIENESLTGNTSADSNVTTEVTTQGSTTIRLSAELSAFDVAETADMVDVTGISEEAGTEIAVKRTASFNMTLFDAASTWANQIFAKQVGRLYVYKLGKINGKPYQILDVILGEVSVDYPDHDLIEISVSGMRQGDWIVPPNSIYYSTDAI